MHWPRQHSSRQHQPIQVRTGTRRCARRPRAFDRRPPTTRRAMQAPEDSESRTYLPCPRLRPCSGSRGTRIEYLPRLQAASCELHRSPAATAACRAVGWLRYVVPSLRCEPAGGVLTTLRMPAEPVSRACASRTADAVHARQRRAVRPSASRRRSRPVLLMYPCTEPAQNRHLDRKSPRLSMRYIGGEQCTSTYFDLPRDERAGARLPGIRGRRTAGSSSRGLWDPPLT